MKSSNLALRLEEDEPQAARPAMEAEVEAHRESPEPGERRPRRSLEFRTISLSDQGFAPFRVR